VGLPCRKTTGAPEPHRLSSTTRAVTESMGFVPGPDVGRALDELLERVVDDPSMNTREELLAYAEERGWPASS